MLLARRPELQQQVGIIGVGMAEAGAGTAALIAEHKPQRVVLCGIAGACDGKVEVGSVVQVESDRVAGLPEKYSIEYSSSCVEGLCRVQSLTADDQFFSVFCSKLVAALAQEHGFIDPVKFISGDRKSERAERGAYLVHSSGVRNCPDKRVFFFVYDRLKSGMCRFKTSFFLRHIVYKVTLFADCTPGSRYQKTLRLYGLSERSVDNGKVALAADDILFCHLCCCGFIFCGKQQSAGFPVEAAGKVYFTVT